MPVEVFGLIISACGGSYGNSLENSSFNIDDPRITHYVVDRPLELISESMKPNKEYIQPQWIVDCLNNRKLLPVSEYGPGKQLPAHLSPYYEYSLTGESKPINIAESTIEQEPEVDNIIKEANETNEEDKELKEMLLSKNKKKLLEKLREEKMKKKRVVKRSDYDVEQKD